MKDQVTRMAAMSNLATGTEVAMMYEGQATMTEAAPSREVAIIQDRAKRTMTTITITITITTMIMITAAMNDG